MQDASRLSLSRFADGQATGITHQMSCTGWWYVVTSYNHIHDFIADDLRGLVVGAGECGGWGNDGVQRVAPHALFCQTQSWLWADSGEQSHS